MTKQVTTVSDEGYSAHTDIREFELEMDSGGEDAPDTLESLLAAYASCFVPALRVGGQQRGVDDLGRIEIDVTGELNDDDKLESIGFDVSVEAEVDDETADRVVERATELCKVHDALKSQLHASIEVDSSGA